ncbi:MAG TPA: heparinase II/III family protein, partial [Abditibacteriaceae bacterium]|nr:heparinase II/III family protein [Abditibacteriaceae bacterium]
MTIHLNDLLHYREPLQRAWGDCLSTPTEATRRIADAAVAGDIFFYGDQQTTIGRSNIDWSGGHHKHQEWRAQINRFYWLGLLAAMSRETGDEKYAEAARDYI